MEKMKGISSILFLLFTMALSVAMISGAERIAQTHPDTINSIPGFHVEYDTNAGRYLFTDSYGVELYPIIISALLTVIFLWKARVPFGGFVALTLLVPLFVSIGVSMASLFFTSTGHTDDEGVGLFAAYLLFVVPPLLGTAFYWFLHRTIGPWMEVRS
jgi:hypothetical protein